MPDIDEQAAIVAPGMMKSHYAPRASVKLNAMKADSNSQMLGFGTISGDLNLSAKGDLREAAANLYAFLKRLDGDDAETIAVAPIPEEGLGIAINDRLKRAAAPRDLQIEEK